MYEHRNDNKKHRAWLLYFRKKDEARTGTEKLGVW